MKKIFIFMIAIMAMVVQTVLAQTPKVTLQHEGNISLYESNDLQTAINAAAAGDTIYLSVGTFTGSIDIDKRLSIIGAGQNSIISGNITISFTDTDGIDSHPRILDALKCTGNVSATKMINDFHIRKCHITNSLSLTGASTNINEGLVDRCFIGNRISGNSSSVKKLIVSNSKIYETFDECNNMTFQNCNINTLASFKGKLINSIVERCGFYNYSHFSNYDLRQEVIAINTLFHSVISKGDAQCQNCYSDNSVNINSSTLDCSYPKESLLSKKYIGLDGTCVGVEGGTTPFTLAPNTPSVYDSNITVDKDTNKLSVTLKVKTE